MICCELLLFLVANASKVSNHSHEINLKLPLLNQSQTLVFEASWQYILNVDRFNICCHNREVTFTTYQATSDSIIDSVFKDLDLINP